MDRIKNLIFDFDGTLVDTAPLIVATMQAAAAELGLPYRTEAECRSTIGRRLEEMPVELWTGVPALGSVFAKTYRRIFDELKRPLKVECFPGVTETLRQLSGKGYRMAIASSRSHKSLEEYVGLFGIAGYFSMLIGGDDVRNGKPAPEPVVTILDALGWKPEETLVVGDAAVDILMGASAGCSTCGVTYGNGTPDELRNAGADITIDSFSVLCNYL